MGGRRKTSIAIGICAIATVIATLWCARRCPSDLPSDSVPTQPAETIVTPEPAARPEPANEGETPPAEEPTVNEKTTGAQEVLDAMSDAARAKIAQITLPVLMFPDANPDDIVTGGEVWYAVSSHRGPIVRSLHVVGKPQQPRPTGYIPKPTETVRSLPAYTGVNEGIRSVNWIEEGVAYSLDIECGTTEADPRCAEPEFALAIANSLVKLEQDKP